MRKAYKDTYYGIYCDECLGQCDCKNTFPDCECIDCGWFISLMVLKLQLKLDEIMEG